MKKNIVALSICIIMISSVLTGAAVIVNNQGNLYSEKEGKVSITIPIGEYKITSASNGDELTVENFGRNLIPGKPNLPSKIFSIAIPPGAEIDEVNYETYNSHVISGNYNIIPVSIPRVASQENPEIYQKEQEKYYENYNEIYGNDNPYPSSVVDLVRRAGYRSYNLADIREILDVNKTADMVSMARPLLCEPNLVQKFEEGKQTKARCIYCNHCAIVIEELPLKCYFGKMPNEEPATN